VRALRGRGCLARCLSRARTRRARRAARRRDAGLARARHRAARLNGPPVQAPAPRAETVSARDAGPPWRLPRLPLCITAIGPTTLNILVPALPNLARALDSDADTVQLAVSLYLIGLASAQLLAGPLSDRFGRRPVALGGLALTAAMSLAALGVGNVASLI